MNTCLDPSKSSGFELTGLGCIPPQPVLLQASHPSLHRGRPRLGAERLLPPHSLIGLSTLTPGWFPNIMLRPLHRPCHEEQAQRVFAVPRKTQCQGAGRPTGSRSSKGASIRPRAGFFPRITSMELFPRAAMRDGRDARTLRVRPGRQGLLIPWELSGPMAPERIKQTVSSFDWCVSCVQMADRVEDTDTHCGVCT